ncbi:hypothetical protein NK8_41710 [Caballeronia sp. NK8]|nr:hypothetical protein NK8_41710 [Caballeronia sp. NK8]
MGRGTNNDVTCRLEGSEITFLSDTAQTHFSFILVGHHKWKRVIAFQENTLVRDRILWIGCSSYKLVTCFEYDYMKLVARYVDGIERHRVQWRQVSEFHRSPV